jgi:hypothetical protein
VRHPAFVQNDKGGFDIAVNPSLITDGCCLGTFVDHLTKSSIAGDGKTILPYAFGKRARDMKRIKRQYSPPFGLNPKSLLIITRICHWENAMRISMQQNVYVDRQNCSCSLCRLSAKYSPLQCLT